MTGSTKRKLRLENKKKKMAALMDIVKLNEYDRTQKNRNAKLEDNIIMHTEKEPSSKRLKTENHNIEEFEPPPLIGEIGPSGKLKIEGEAFAELKKMLREKTQRTRNLPILRLRELGINAGLAIELNDRVPLFLPDLQHLIMYSQIGVHAPYSPARWCALDKYNRLQNTNLLIVENASLYHFTAHESMFPFLSSFFDHKVEMITPSSYNSDIVKDLSMVPLTGTQMKKFQNNFGTLETAVLKSDEIFDTVKNFFPIMDIGLPESTVLLDGKRPNTDTFSRTELLLSGWQMVEENFPLPIKGLMERKYSGYVLTKEKYKHITPFSPMYAIDCEMCRTSTGELELTRISCVNEKQEVFYDTLVKPDNEIVDYLTKWSGINKNMMKNVSKKLKDVQEDLNKLLPEDSILIGQSLSNDLHALKMMHPYIIDTSVIYNITGDRSRKTKLQTLAREFMKEKIQVGHGHCSTEDSLACMKLVQLRLRKHLYYGDAVMGGVKNDLRTYPEMGTAQYATSMLRQCVKVDKTANVIGVDEIGLKYKFYVDKGEEKDLNNVTCSSMKSNKEVIRTYCDSLKSYSLNIAHIRLSDNQLEGNNCKIFKNVDKWIKEIYEHSTSPSLLMVLFAGQKQANGVCFLQIKKEFV